MRVLVADDHSLFRDGIISLLKSTGFDVVEQVGNGQAAVEAALRLQPDVVLMDIAMPEMNGLDALCRIKAKAPNVKVVMLTMSEDDADLMQAIKCGADGYLLKNLHTHEFVQLLNNLERGEAPMSPQTVTRLMRGLTGPASEQMEPAQSLTGREIELLQLVAEGLPNKAIAHRLSISENTVKYHLSNILQKLGAKNRTEAAMHAARAGLLDAALSN
jgi:DNA-binding NarL/FixJ family response regulator